MKPEFMRFYFTFVEVLVILCVVRSRNERVSSVFSSGPCSHPTLGSLNEPFLYQVVIRVTKL